MGGTTIKVTGMHPIIAGRGRMYECFNKAEQPVCFPAGVTILLEDGSEIAIEKLSIGTRVSQQDSKTGSFQGARVEDVKRHTAILGLCADLQWQKNLDYSRTFLLSS